MTITQKPARFCSRAVEFRADAVSDGRTLEGYAAVFGAPTRIDSWEGEFDEQITSGAFRKSLTERVPVLQFDHGRDARTGSLPIGSLLDIREDDRGLFVSARLFENELVEPIRQAIESGAIDGMSFRFRVLQDEWVDREGKRVKDTELLDLLWRSGDRGPLLRSIKEVELFELGPVVFPAYDSTSVGVRSLLAQLGHANRRTLVRDLAREVREVRADDEEERDGEGEPVYDESLDDEGEFDEGADSRNDDVEDDESDDENEDQPDERASGAEPAVRHSGYLREATHDWYLPPPAW